MQGLIRDGWALDYVLGHWKVTFYFTNHIPIYAYQLRDETISQTYERITRELLQ